MLDIDPYRVKPGERVSLADRPTRDDAGLDKDDGEAELDRLRRRMYELQEKLYADGRSGLLVVLQAMDAGGKDSTLRHVFGHLNPQGCRVASFKVPTPVEQRHDFLWRIHKEAPERGYIRIFNRSHYEDVLVVRVKGLVEEHVWRARYDHINAFERLLADEGVRVLKFYLHISKDYQKQRLQRRLDRPDKLWKFNPKDVDERAHWDDYMAAFEDAMSRCSTEAAPWFVVPAERRWFRNLLVARAVVETLTAMDPRFPEPDFDPAGIVL